VIASAAALLLCAVLIVWLLRAVTGRTLHDRALGAHAAALTGALLAAALAAIVGQPAWLDLSLALAIGDAILVVAVMKVFRVRSLQTALARPLGPGER
jgi:multisubunit Na+/H+ antiporter MnhF subunit